MRLFGDPEMSEVFEELESCSSEDPHTQIAMLPSRRAAIGPKCHET